MVYVSSHNIVSSLGFNSDENYKNISDNISGIKIINDLALSPEPVAVSLVNTKELNSEFSQISDSTGYTRFEKLLILSINDALKKSEIDINNPKTLLIISTTKGNIDLLEKNKAKLFDKERVQLWRSSDIIKDFFKYPNTPITVSNACVSGALSIIIAKRLIAGGQYDHAVVAGADILPEFTLSGFLAFKAVSEEACMPFDINRTGMTPGEGAGTIILTKDQNKALKPNIIISGGSSSNDANHISGPSRTGEELAISVDKSLKEAKLIPQNIDYVCAHGTATLYNDEMEAKALTLSGLENVPTNSIKGYIGHTFGAAGIIETIMGVYALSENKLIKSLAYNEQGTENKVNIITGNYERSIFNVLKTASGFGGCNTSLVISKSNLSGSKLKLNELKYNILNNVKLSGNRLFINDREINITDDAKELSFSKYTKTVYKHFGIKYPKYYKMDNLSKLAFLASEILVKNDELIKTYKEDEIAVILSNGSSSLDTDAEYQKTIDDKNNYFPSPSVFVYTLANVMIGEICIRNKIKGENTVFISKDFNKEFIFDYVDILFKTGKAKACITGRVEYNYPNGNYDAELYLLESKI